MRSSTDSKRRKVKIEPSSNGGPSAEAGVRSVADQLQQRQSRDREAEAMQGIWHRTAQERRTAVVPASIEALQQAIELPQQVLQVIGLHLGHADLPAARLVCKFWSEHISEATPHFSAVMNPHRGEQMVQMYHAQKLLPTLRSADISCGARMVRSETVDYFFEQLSWCGSLNALALRFVCPVLDSRVQQRGALAYSHTRRNDWIAPLSRLTSLKSLALHDAVFPSGPALEGLSAIQGLTELVVNCVGGAPQPGGLPWSQEVNYTDAVSSAFWEQQAPPWPSRTDFARLLPGVGRSLKRLELSLPPAPEELFSLAAPSAASKALWGEMVSAASQLHQLQGLSLSGGRVEIRELQALCGALTGLQELSLGMEIVGGTVSQSHLDHLENLKELRIVLKGDTATGQAAAHSLVTDMKYLTNQVPGKLVGLTVTRLCGLGSSHAAKLVQLWGACGLRELTLRITATVPTELSSGLWHLSKLTRLSLDLRPDAARPACYSGLFTAFRSDVPIHLPLLQSLSLTGFMAIDMGAYTGGAVPSGALPRLITLVVRTHEANSCLLPLPKGLLDETRLEHLALRGVRFTCPTSHAPLHGLSSLSLAQCSVGCLSHWASALEALKDLRDLQLDDIIGLRDVHLEALACLTALTALGVSAVSNQHVTNLPLARLGPLVRLQRLRWLAGDMLDAMIDPGHLRPFARLQLLTISASMYHRMTRWGSITAFHDLLPCCDIETVGP